MAGKWPYSFLADIVRVYFHIRITCSARLSLAIRSEGSIAQDWEGQHSGLREQELRFLF